MEELNETQDDYYNSPIENSEMEEALKEPTLEALPLGNEFKKTSPMVKIKKTLTDLKNKFHFKKSSRKPLDEFGLHQSDRNRDFHFKKRPLILVGVVVLVLFVIGSYLMVSASNRRNQLANQPKPSTDPRIEVPDARATDLVNREFDFPLNDSTGKEVTKIKYTIQSAQLLDQIVVQGQKATAIKGKTFLVINLKLENDYTKAIQINTKDYIRLTKNAVPDLLAADIHSDPVTVDPVSTKYTRIGYAIDDTDTNLQLQVGEIGASKTTIDIHF